MAIADAIAHLQAARDALSLEAYRGLSGGMERFEHFTLAEDLKRIDAAIGSKGASIFAAMAESVIEAYVEIVAAQRALSAANGGA